MFAHIFFFGIIDHCLWCQRSLLVNNLFYLLTCFIELLLIALLWAEQKGRRVLMLMLCWSWINHVFFICASPFFRWLWVFVLEPTVLQLYLFQLLVARKSAGKYQEGLHHQTLTLEDFHRWFWTHPYWFPVSLGALTHSQPSLGCWFCVFSPEEGVAAERACSQVMCRLTSNRERIYWGGKKNQNLKCISDFLKTIYFCQRSIEERTKASAASFLLRPTIR